MGIIIYYVLISKYKQLFADTGEARVCSINSFVIYSLIKLVTDPFPPTALQHHPKCDMFLERHWADQTGNVGNVGNVGKVGKVEKEEKLEKVGKAWKVEKRRKVENYEN